ncbi:MAG TPA: hypothetical protein VMZ92_00445 [Planctomycetota bacterium]|nr:hypothetical protein [Planctomycetota bacterium]
MRRWCRIGVQWVQPAHDEAEHDEHEPDEADAWASAFLPMANALISRWGLAQEHSGQGGVLARELLSSSSNRC